jgi:serine/threonine protein phosphatase PrpC
VASDGLWDKLDNSEAVNIVHDTGGLPPLLHLCTRMPACLRGRLMHQILCRGKMILQ